MMPERRGAKGRGKLAPWPPLLQIEASFPNLRLKPLQQPEDLRTTLFVSQIEALLGTTRVVTLPGKRRITLSVPAGVHDGQQIRLEGEGQPSTDGGPAGDLVITIKFRQTQEIPLISQLDSESSSHAPRIEDIPTDPLGSRNDPLSLLPNIEEMPTLPVSSSNAPPPGPVMMEDTPPFPHPPTNGNVPSPGARSVSPFDPQYIVDILTRSNSFIRRLPPGRALLLIMLLLLVIAGSIGLFYTINNNQKAVRNAIATSTAISASRTAQATPSYPFSTTLLLTDPLRDNSTGNQWEEGGNSDGSCSFVGGVYHARISLPDRFRACIARNFYASNFTYEVRLKILTGDCGGMIFRRSGPRFYYFRVCADGSYAFIRYTSDANTALNVMLESGTHPAIHQGLNQANLLAVVAFGSKLDMYVNRQLIASVKDTSYAEGQIGLVAKARNNATEVAFSNLMVWKL